MIVLTALADATSVSTAMFVGAVVLAVAAPLYLPAWREPASRKKSRKGPCGVDLSQRPVDAPQARTGPHHSDQPRGGKPL